MIENLVHTQINCVQLDKYNACTSGSKVASTLISIIIIKTSLQANILSLNNTATVDQVYPVVIVRVLSSTHGSY